MDIHLYQKNLERYREDLEVQNVPKERIASFLPMKHSTDALLAHAHNMLDQMETMLADDTPEQREKFLKWYGFLQCILVVSGTYSLDETRAHNRST